MGTPPHHILNDVLIIHLYLLFFNFFVVVAVIIRSAVSSFDPDSRFMSNVLSRLEAVMGIQIVSALANIHSLLTTTSGVQRQTMFYRSGHETNPQTDPGWYVEEVFSQWSAGHSHRPPTWRHLLEVLRDIGLIELSEQIEMYMKGIIVHILESAVGYSIYKCGLIV